MPDKVPTPREFLDDLDGTLLEEDRVQVATDWRDAIRRGQRHRSARLVAVWAARDAMGVSQPTLAEMILHDKED